MTGSATAITRIQEKGGHAPAAWINRGFEGKPQQPSKIAFAELGAFWLLFGDSKSDKTFQRGYFEQYLLQSPSMKAQLNMLI